MTSKRLSRRTQTCKKYKVNFRNIERREETLKIKIIQIEYKESRFSALRSIERTMMIMKMGETAVVLSLLNSDLRPIEEVLAEFNSKFPRSRYLTVCSSLSLLLQARSLARSLFLFFL